MNTKTGIRRWGSRVTTKKRQLIGLGRLTKPFKEQKRSSRTSASAKNISAENTSVVMSDTPIKLMKVSHALTLIYIALLLAFSIVAVQNNRVRKAHSELLEKHDALYVETQVLRLEAADITSPMAIRTWAKNQGMVPYYSSVMELEQLEPTYLPQETPISGLGGQ